MAFPPPQCFVDLARIHRFKLFVSVTFDSLLADAINATRFGGNAKTEVIAYSPNDIQDLGSEKKRLDRPVVYHLLGKLSASPDYVMCDEDVLEFLQTMQTDSRRPHLLFDELKNNHLLILGCSFSDWLARFFIRLAKNQPLSLRRDQMEVLVDSAGVHDANLALFLQQLQHQGHFGHGGRVAYGTIAPLARAAPREGAARTARAGCYPDAAGSSFSGLCERRSGGRRAHQDRLGGVRSRGMVRQTPAGSRRRLGPEDPA
jgi:SIR2-like domain